MKDFTLAIIKPDAVRNGKIEEIIEKIDQSGFNIVERKETTLTPEMASSFYGDLSNSKFFDELVEFMASGPIVVLKLKKENAVGDFRKLIGATDPLMADSGTLRKLYGKDIGSNAIHGSDSDASASKEIDFFFGKEKVND